MQIKYLTVAAVVVTKISIQLKYFLIISKCPLEIILSKEKIYVHINISNTSSFKFIQLAIML